MTGPGVFGGNLLSLLMKFYRYNCTFIIQAVNIKHFTFTMIGLNLTDHV